LGVAATVCLDFLSLGRRNLVSEQAAPLQTESSLTKFLNGTWNQQLEGRLLAESSLKELLLPPWSLFLYSVSGRTNEEVTRGQDGWLFLTSRLHPPKDGGSDLLLRTTANFSALNQRLRGIGIGLCLVPIPTKAWVYPEKAPAGVDTNAAFHRSLLAEFDDQHLEVMDLWHVWRKAQTQEDRYCHTDSHWSWFGARLAAEAIAEHAGLLVPEEERITNLEVVAEFPDVGDLVRMLGFDRLLHESPRLLSLVRSLGVEIGSQVAHTVKHSSGETALGTPWKGNHSAPLLVAGTSFSAWPEFDRYLQHASGGRARLEAARGGGLCSALLVAITRILAQPHLDPPPSVIVLEFPIAILWTETRPFDEFGALFASLPAPHLKPAANNRAPQHLVHYLRELANDFHSYYNAHAFIVDDAALCDARLTLISATRVVLGNGLGILGVSAPEKM
jgi:hypothetical protein